MTTSEQLLTTKELANALRCSLRFVQAMVGRGFQMPGRRATVAEAREWLRNNPPPCSRKAWGAGCCVIVRDGA